MANDLFLARPVFQDVGFFIVEKLTVENRTSAETGFLSDIDFIGGAE